MTKGAIEKCNIHPKLDIHWNTCLDVYKGATRTKMVREGIWSNFQMEKAKVIAWALEHKPDTLYLDADQMVVGEICDVNVNRDIGISPHYTQASVANKYGYFNGGLLWTRNKSVPIDWISYTTNSRYFDQAAIEDLARKYKYFEFGKNYNFGQFRLNAGVWNLTSRNKKLYVDDLELKTIHTHFDRAYPLNSIVKNLLRQTNNSELIWVLRESHKPSNVKRYDSYLG